MNHSINIKELRKQRLESSSAVDKGNGNFIWNLLGKEISLRKGLPDALKEIFYLELATLLGAGIDIRTAIELIADNQPKEKYRKIFRLLLRDIINGKTFSMALMDAGSFSIYEYYSVQIGEETGKINRVLHEISGYYKKRIRQRRQIIGALTYPVIVLTIAVAAIAFMMTFVVPMFSDVFKRFGGDLPMATRMVVYLSSFIKSYFLFFILIIISVTFGGFSQRKKQWFRRLSSRIMIGTPLINKLICKVYLARFSNTMALLLGAKVPMLKAIKMSRHMIGFYSIEQSLLVVESQILTGMPLHEALSNFAFYPKKMIAMLKVGEDINQLDIFFAKISDQYAEEVEHQTNVMGKFVEPMIIILLGSIVGAILIAMYLPLFKLGQSF
jgi:type IV pilus assembly protein PilC